MNSHINHQHGVNDHAAQEEVHRLGVPRIDWSEKAKLNIPWWGCATGGKDARRDQSIQDIKNGVYRITIGKQNAKGKDYGLHLINDLVDRVKAGENVAVILHATGGYGPPSGVVGVVEINAEDIQFGGPFDGMSSEYQTQCRGNYDDEIVIPFTPIDDCPILPENPVVAGGWKFTRQPSYLRKNPVNINAIIEELKKEAQIH
jgi:hypothetical protein